MDDNKLFVSLQHILKWFSRKYYASVMNIKEFYEDNIGKSFTGILMKLGHDYGK